MSCKPRLRAKWTLVDAPHVDRAFGSDLYAIYITFDGRADAVNDTLAGLTTEFLIWNVNEINLIIYCACLPTIRPLFRNFFDKVGELTNLSKSNTHKRSGHRLESSRSDTPVKMERFVEVDTERGILPPAASRVRRTTDWDVIYEEHHAKAAPKGEWLSQTSMYSRNIV